MGINAVISGVRTPVTAPRHGKARVGTLDLIEWAFQREKISLDFDDCGGEAAGGPSFGMEYVLLERARLGCHVQGGGTSPRHHDADMVASSLVALPDVYGGRRMAVQIAELARAGQVPNWAPHSGPVCQPIEWRRSKHGLYGVTAENREIGNRWPQSQLTKSRDGSVCPVAYHGTARDVGRLRRGYLDWYRAIHHLRFMLQKGCHLTSFTVSEALPARTPWKKVLT